MFQGLIITRVFVSRHSNPAAAKLFINSLIFGVKLSFQYAKHVGKRKLMPPNPLLLMASVDCDEYAEVASWS